MVPRILISSLSSSSGKTTVVCALSKILSTKFSKKVSVLKVGPDYIDPLFHSKTANVRTGNIDLFFSGSDSALLDVFERDTDGSDFAVVEGAMGFYDGATMNADASAFRVAQSLGCPVIIVVDAKGKSLSVCSEIDGLIGFQEKIESDSKKIIPREKFAVILNRCSKSLFELLSPKIRGLCGVEVLGFIEKNPDFSIESRHLGLVTPDAVHNLSEKIEHLSSSVSETVDFEKLIRFAQSSSSENGIFIRPKSTGEKKVLLVPSVKIAVARDEAFCFYYQENFSLLRSFGAELKFFSPLKNEPVPSGCSALYIGGGYPELFWNALADSKITSASVKRFCRSGAPVFAECGGFMYLQLLGILPGSFSKKDKLVRFGYVELTAGEDNFLLKKGEKIRGHEFHYFDTSENGESFTATKPNGKTWKCIKVDSAVLDSKNLCARKKRAFEKNIVAGFPHFYFPSNVSVAENFVNAALLHASVSDCEISCAGCGGCSSGGCGNCGGCKNGCSGCSKN
ncbi:MAG: cobyrinate a,c-diamide synthase [Treponema sp.]|nr:cobyrinate a,c-diamide synthase [Treponema sp.]